MTIRNIWAVDYTHKGDSRSMLIETSADDGYAEADAKVHPSIKARDYTLTFIGEAINV